MSNLFPEQKLTNALRVNCHSIKKYLSVGEFTDSEEVRLIEVIGTLPEESFSVSLKDWLIVLSPLNEPIIIASTEY